MNNELFELLKYAKKSIPFYAKYISDEFEKNCTEKVFETLPIVNKQMYKSRIDMFVCEEIRKSSLHEEILDFHRYCKNGRSYDLENGKIFIEYTSGTTGSPFFSIKNIRERTILGKYLWRCRSKIYNINSKNIFDFIHYSGGKRYPFPFEPPRNIEERIQEEIKYLINAPFEWWHTNIHILEQYNRIYDNKKITIKNLKVIENNGAYISPKEKIEYGKRYNCKVVDNYGCREVWTIAYECPCGYLHVCDNIILELVDDKDNVIVNCEEIGTVIVTSMIQRSMPFIRYKLGDQAFYVKGKCSCGNDNPRIKLLPGRHLIKGTNLYGNDIFRRVVISLLLDYNLKKYDSINVIQTKYDTFDVHIIQNRENIEDIEKGFIAAATAILGNDKYFYNFYYEEEMETKSIFNVV